MENLNLNAEISASETNKVLNAEIKAKKLAEKKAAKKSATNVEKKSDNKVLTGTNKKGEAILKLNLDKFKNVLNKFSGKEIVAKDNMYIYPPTFTELDKVSKKGKQFRQNRRNKIDAMFNNVQLFAKYDRTAELIAESKTFETYYKENYLVNDFSVASVSRSVTGAKLEFIKDSLDMIKEILTQTGKKGKK